MKVTLAMTSPMATLIMSALRSATAAARSDLVATLSVMASRTIVTAASAWRSSNPASRSVLAAAYVSNVATAMVFILPEPFPERNDGAFIGA